MSRLSSSNLMRAAAAHQGKKSQQFIADQRQKVPRKLTANGIFGTIWYKQIQASKFLVASLLVELLS